METSWKRFTTIDCENSMINEDFIYEQAFYYKQMTKILGR